MVSLAPAESDAGLQLPGVDVTPFAIESGESKFDLTFGSIIRGEVRVWRFLLSHSSFSARVTVLHVKLAIELPPAHADKLRAEAERLGLSVEELARAALTDLLSTPDLEFQAVARRVVTKNRELYKRLA